MDFFAAEGAWQSASRRYVAGFIKEELQSYSQSLTYRALGRARRYSDEPEENLPTHWSALGNGAAALCCIAKIRPSRAKEEF